MIDQIINDKAQAFSNNPQALQQQYAVKQDLLDLLALQKIKSEKEAAAREMQLQLAQQQAAQGGIAPVKDKLEREVNDMTKKEMAQQIGGVAQQQEQRKQAGLQQLMQRMGQTGQAAPQMSGIAKAPAPNMANMAGGGIVAFKGGDLVSDEEIEALKKYRMGIADPAERERLAREKYEKDVKADERIAEQRRLAEEAYKGATKEEDAYEGLKRLLLSMGRGTTTAASLRQAGEADMTFKDQRRQQAQRALEQRNKALMELTGSEMEAGKGLYGAGAASREKAEATQRSAMGDISADRRAEFEAKSAMDRAVKQAMARTGEERMYATWAAQQPPGSDKSMERFFAIKGGGLTKGRGEIIAEFQKDLFVRKEIEKITKEQGPEAAKQYAQEELQRRLDTFEKGLFGGSVSTPAKPTGSSQPSPAAIDYLKRNPQFKNQFDEKYGQGAAARVLGK